MPNYKRYYLKDFNYIFITLVTYDRKNILIENINLLRNSFKKVLQTYNFKITAICVMKDHLHLILEENELKNYSKIIANFKKYFSYYLKNRPHKQNLSESMQKRNEAGVWQRRFYEHIIRDEEDFNIHLDYIHYNSTKHYGIAPKDWKYSSFKKFVKMKYYDEYWCNFKYGEIDFE